MSNLINYLSKLEYVQPMAGVDVHGREVECIQLVQMTVGGAIDVQRRVAGYRNNLPLSDLQLLEDFKVIHYAREMKG